jgi:hypothetical protein
MCLGNGFFCMSKNFHEKFFWDNDFFNRFHNGKKVSKVITICLLAVFSSNLGKLINRISKKKILCGGCPARSKALFIGESYFFVIASIS